MKNSIKRRRAITKMVMITVLAFAIVVAASLLYSTTGVWWPAAVATVVLFAEIFLWLLPYYYKKTAFVCPSCGEVIKPSFWEVFFALHTPTKRKVYCSVCNRKHWCKETYDDTSDN